MLYEQIQEKHDAINIEEFNDDELRKYRQDIAKTQALLARCMRETAKERPPIDDVEVVEYINTILDNGFNLKSTELSANKTMLEAQHVKAFKGLIKRCVQNSAFSVSAFKIKGLRKQRSNIESAATLHLLRQAVNDMIPVLQMYREFTALLPISEATFFADMEYESILAENEALTKQLIERDRILSEVLGLYNDSSIQLPNKIEQIKKLHNCSEVKACEILGVGRTTLKRAKDSQKAVPEVVPNTEI